MSFVDSAAVFWGRVSDLGLAEFKPKFEAAGWTSMGSFAFAAGIPGGSTIEDKTFFKKVLVPILDLADDAEEPPKSASLKRLWFEAHSMYVADLRRRMERTDDDPPRRIPTAERDERKGLLAQRLGGAFKMEGELEPANVLIDRFIQMADDGIVEWVPWEECPKRDQELRSARGKKRWMADASGIVKEKETPKDVTTDTSSVIRIQWAMRRRGLALDVAGLMSYEAHDLLVDKLVGAVTGEAIDSRYAVPSLQQAHSADKEVWRQLQKATRVGLRGAPIGAPRPLDEPLKGVLVSAELCFILLPLPSVTATKPAASKGASADPEVGRLRKEVQELKKKLASTSGGGGGGGSSSGSGCNGSAKGKGRGNG